MQGVRWRSSFRPDRVSGPAETKYSATDRGHRSTCSRQACRSNVASTNANDEVTSTAISSAASVADRDGDRVPVTGRTAHGRGTRTVAISSDKAAPYWARASLAPTVGTRLSGAMGQDTPSRSTGLSPRQSRPIISGSSSAMPDRPKPAWAPRTDSFRSQSSKSRLSVHPLLKTSMEAWRRSLRIDAQMRANPSGGPSSCWKIQPWS